MLRKTTLWTLVILFFSTGLAMASNYTVKAEHPGGNVTPLQAYEMMQKDPVHTFIVDIRTRYEYQDIGHPVGAYNIPYKFYTTEMDAKGYKKVLNKNFKKDLLARFNPKTDRLLLICRSGKRSCGAVKAAIEAGFKPEMIYNVMGGVEGDKIKDKSNPHYGQRLVNGWKMENLPWTYNMDSKLMYQNDIM